MVCSIQWGFDEVDDKHFCFESHYFSMVCVGFSGSFGEALVKDGGPISLLKLRTVILFSS